MCQAATFFRFGKIDERMALAKIEFQNRQNQIAEVWYHVQAESLEAVLKEIQKGQCRRTVGTKYRSVHSPPRFDVGI